ncbi:uncharacterized protein LOC6558965 [Drosophila grimshawi]|uniref:GH15782 n=1 Tax=Drosophila grimshawi TaxID=7222 RepID=B4IZ53_DROGR|nr:uncharacterized protein LOC6558965 [Drosophila grimshawi]EDV95575.1 GH15782 [Drosophila grimshawi]
MAERVYSQVIERYVPQLVKVLLDSPEENEVYTKSLQYAMNMIQIYSERPRTEPTAVWLNLREFVNRYRDEQLPVLADAIRKLSNVIIDDFQIGEQLKWAIIDFMLSVNYCPFRVARFYKQAHLECSELILKDLALAHKTAQQISIKKHLSLNSLKRSLHLELGMRQSEVQAGESRKDSVSQSPDLTALSSANSTPARSECGMWQLPPALQQVKQMELELSKQVGIKAQFSYRFAKYLSRNLAEKGSQFCDCDESFFIQETLQVFFRPAECHHFVLLNELIQLRPQSLNVDNIDDQQLVEQLLKPVQHMQCLYAYIDCYNKAEQLEMLHSLTAALRRLLMPVVETLTHYASSIREGLVKATLASFRQATQNSFKRLQPLCSLTAANYVSYKLQLKNSPHYRSQHIVTSLLEVLATWPHADHRRYAAALLLQVLQVPCRCLDNLWLLGDFEDGFNEFRFKRVKVKGHTAYLMREAIAGVPLKPNAIYKIIEQHIQEAGATIAWLCDSQRLSHFVAQHELMLRQSLHHALLKSVQLQQPQQLDQHKMEMPQPTVAAPEIFQQLNLVSDWDLRCIYFKYVKETLQDLKQSGYCNIEALLKCCQNCDLKQIICETLQRQLKQRFFWVNTYVLHLLLQELKLGKVLRQLRSIYLLHNFDLYATHLEIAFGCLEQGFAIKAAEQLQQILHIQHAPLDLKVELPSANLAQLSLIFNFNPQLRGIITEAQLQQYNEIFRVRLQLHTTVHRLQQLLQLNCDQQEVAIVLQLKTDLLLEFGKHFQAQLLQQAAQHCDEQLQLCGTLDQLQQLHQEYVQLISKSYLNRFEQQLQDLFSLSVILLSNWRRLEFLFETGSGNGNSNLERFDRHYQVLNRRYLLSITHSMQVLHATL